MVNLSTFQCSGTSCNITPSSFPCSSVVSNDTSMFMAVKAFPNLFRLWSGCLWLRRMGEGLPPETSAVFIFAAVQAATFIVSLAHQSHSILRNSSLSSSANMQILNCTLSLDPLETRGNGLKSGRLTLIQTLSDCFQSQSQLHRLTHRTGRLNARNKSAL